MTRLLAYALSASLIAASAIAQTQDQTPSSSGSTSEPQQDRGEAWTYIKPDFDFSRFRAVVVEPTSVYKGPDAQFTGITPEDRARFAELLTEALRSELATSPGLSTPGPDVLRVKATILGAEKTTRGGATASQGAPIGVATNAIKSIVGKPGNLTGSVLVAIEISDSKTNELVAAAVRREAPDALDIPATLSTADTVKAVAQGMAKKLRERLDHAMRKS